MITLIVVDCQNDFITGTMSVKGAKNSVDEIKNFIKKHCKEIEKIIFAIEWHPYNHSSFKKYGGEYQHHCIQYTPGACIEPKLLKYVQSLNINYEVSTRGEIEESTEFGAFNDIEYVQDNLFGERYYFDSVATANANTEFIICGVSNSVSSTINNMMKEEIVPKVFFPGIISNDGGKTFSEFVKLNKLEKIV
jgi:nicotinamidase/pyrazinamidase